MAKILDIGSGPNVAFPFEHFGEGTTVTRLDINPDTNPDILHDIIEPLPEEHHGQYDIVMCIHMLEHIDRMKVITVVENMIAALKDQGELWIAVPSLEWAANRILQQEADGATLAHIYGSQDTPWQYHRCGFTLLMLRGLLQAKGLVIRQARQEPYHLATDEHMGDIMALQNIAVGWKPPGD